MVSVGISSLGLTKLISIDPGVKINGSCYRNTLLRQHHLPAIRSIRGLFHVLNEFTFQRDSAPAHHARKTVALRITHYDQSMLGRSQKIVGDT